jgi:hypothetical protein
MYTKKQEKRALNDFHQSLEVMSKTMNKEEYSLVAGVMFRLLMGSRFGYTEHDPRIYKMFNLFGCVLIKKYENKEKDT